MTPAAERDTSPSVTPAVTVERLGCATRRAPLARPAQRYCSDARQRAYRRRQSHARLPAARARVPAASAIYECSGCGQRLLDERRCPDCNLFCRRVGAGGPCPHCDEPVAVADLLPLTEA